jgi:acetylornithine deacetylase
MPGESLAAIDQQFQTWFAELSRAFPTPPTVEHPIRWLPGSALDPGHPLVHEFARAAREATGHAPAVQGIEGPCDLFVFHEFGIPALLWGPSGANLHMPDEYVDIDSLLTATKALLHFVCTWCEIDSV